MGWTGLGAIGQLLTVVAAVAGFYFVWRQLLLASKAGTSQLYGLVSAAMQSVNSALISTPDWIPYFEEGKHPPGSGPLAAQLNKVCELIMDMVDAVVEQKRALPELAEMDWSTWDSYFRWLYRSSPTLRNFVDDSLKGDFYPDYIYAAVGVVVVRDRISGAIDSVWVAEDELGAADVTAARRILASALPPRGYPWIRTWLFKRRESGRTLAGEIVAAVEGVSESRARVTWRERTGVTSSGRVRTVLDSWILGTMAGTSVKAAEFDRDGERTVYHVRPPRLHSFLIPEYRASWRDSAVR